MSGDINDAVESCNRIRFNNRFSKLRTNSTESELFTELEEDVVVKGKWGSRDHSPHDYNEEEDAKVHEAERKKEDDKHLKHERKEERRKDTTRRRLMSE